MCKHKGQQNGWNITQIACKTKSTKKIITQIYKTKCRFWQKYKTKYMYIEIPRLSDFHSTNVTPIWLNQCKLSECKGQVWKQKLSKGPKSQMFKYHAYANYLTTYTPVLKPS